MVAIVSAEQSTVELPVDPFKQRRSSLALVKYASALDLEVFEPSLVKHASALDLEVRTLRAQRVLAWHVICGILV